MKPNRGQSLTFILTRPRETRFQGRERILGYLLIVVSAKILVVVDFFIASLTGCLGATWNEVFFHCCCLLCMPYFFC